MLQKFNPSKTKHITQINKMLGLFFHTPKAQIPLSISKIKNILVLDFTGLGDIVMLTPFLRTLKRNCPTAKITLVCSMGGQEVLSEQHLADRFVALDRKCLSSPFKMLWNFLTIYRALRQINQEVYDFALEPRGDLRHIFFMHFCKAIRKASYNYTGGECFLTDVVIPSEGPVHLVEDKLDFLKQLGFAVSNKDIYPRLLLTKTQEEGNKTFLKTNNLEKKTIIGIHPGASQIIRKWPYYPELLTLLNQQIPNAVFLVFEGVEDRLQADAIMEAASRKHALALRVKTSLKDMIARLACCDFVVCNDSGAGHIAAALEVLTFVIFGPANPEMVKPYNLSGVYPIKGSRLSCKNVCKKSCNCPPGCLKQINAPYVYEIIRKRIGLSKGSL